MQKNELQQRKKKIAIISRDEVFRAHRKKSLFITDDKELSKIFNEYNTNIVKNTTGTAPVKVSSQYERPEVFCKKAVVNIFAKFTGKHLCQSLFCNKVTGHRPATLLRKRLWHRYFPVNFTKFLRSPFYRTPPVAASG